MGSLVRLQACVRASFALDPRLCGGLNSGETPIQATKQHICQTVKQHLCEAPAEAIQQLLWKLGQPWWRVESWQNTWRRQPCLWNQLWQEQLEGWCWCQWSIQLQASLYEANLCWGWRKVHIQRQIS